MAPFVAAAAGPLSGPKARGRLRQISFFPQALEIAPNQRIKISKNFTDPGPGRAARRIRRSTRRNPLSR
jgi:hypothetical protein